MVVLAPLTTHPFWADHRLSIYGYGGVYLDRPWRLPVDALGAVPYFLSVGNFRPLGRIYEWSLDVVVLGLVDLVGLPANIGLRLVGLAAAVLLTAAVVLLTRCVTSRGPGPSMAVALAPFAVGAGFVAAGRMSTTILFSGLYLFTSALVLAVAAWACVHVGAPRLGARGAVLGVLAGAGIAGFNELACLAVPLATVAVLLRARLVIGVSWRDAGFRFVGALWAGFLPVFLPVRAIIRANCAAGGCYEGSDVAVADAAATLPNRLVSGLAPLMWRWAVEDRGWPLGVAVAAFVLLLLVALRIVRASASLAVLDRRQVVALAGVAASVIVLAAAMASLNVWVQEYASFGRYGVGWRDSALTAAGGGVLVVALAGCARRRVGMVVLPLLVVAAAVSTAANAAYHDGAAAEALPFLHNRIAQEMADFDRTAAGDARRCQLRASFLSTTSAENEARIDKILDVAAGQVAGRRFCSRAPLRPGPVPLYRVD